MHYIFPPSPSLSWIGSFKTGRNNVGMSVRFLECRAPIPACDSIGPSREHAKYFKVKRTRARLNLSIPGASMQGMGDTGMREERTGMQAAPGLSLVSTVRGIKKN